eukprot:scaffold41864_cov153-Amphora_coffeaeformis.AAC.1
MPSRTATRFFTQYFAHKDNHNDTAKGGKHTEAAAGLGGGRQEAPAEGVPSDGGSTSAFPNNQRPKSRPPCQPWDYNVSVSVYCVCIRGRRLGHDLVHDVANILLHRHRPTFKVL